MKVTKIGEYGSKQALFGLGLSYGLTSQVNFWSNFYFNEQLNNQMQDIALKCVSRGNGHDKFLESISVWLDITAARYWWQQFDTYRVGVTKQSESTMHTVLKKRLTMDDFEGGIHWLTLGRLNCLIRTKNFLQLKRELPESFLQRRVVCTNYKALRHIYWQRKDHKLPEWQYFFDKLIQELNEPWYLTNE